MYMKEGAFLKVFTVLSVSKANYYIILLEGNIIYKSDIPVSVSYFRLSVFALKKIIDTELHIFVKK